MQADIRTEVLSQSSSIDLSFSDIDSAHFHMDSEEPSDLPESTPSIHGTGEAVNEESSVTSDTSLETKTTLERDPIYFCQNVYLVVEDRLFCVPKGGLVQHGSYFQSLLAVPANSNDDAHLVGDSEEHPVILEGIAKRHFQNFLRLIYPFYGVELPSGDESWLGVLDLATKWGFEQVRQTAITHLEHIFTITSPHYDPIRALYICQKYNIQKYIKQQFETLITSDQSLNRPAMQACGIDIETILLLMDLRDRWMSGWFLSKKPGDVLTNVKKRKLFAQKVIQDHFTSVDAPSRTEDSASSVHVATSGEQDNDPGDKGGSHAEGSEADNNKGALQADDATSDADEFEDDNDPLRYHTHDRIKHLARLYIVKQRTIALIGEVNEWEGPIEAKNCKLRVLTKKLAQDKRQIRTYWARATRLSPSIPLSEIVNEYQSVDLVGLDNWGTADMIEGALLKLMHPEANSLSISLDIGSTSKSQDIVKHRRSRVDDMHKRYHLANYEVRSSQINANIKKYNISEAHFHTWLDRI